MSRTPTETHPHMPPTQLDRDETRVLAECESESLIYRSIPLGLITFFATQYAMSRNIITTKGKWIKLGAGLFAGYIIGKVSYAPTCRKKILTQIPDSNLAHAIRGVEVRQAAASSDDRDHQSYIPRQSKDPSEAVVFLPDPVDPDTHTVPVGVNQYGDPIYATAK
jgi:hypothetical protein